MLALEYRATVESMSYFWRILDLDRQGRLSPASIKFFYAGERRAKYQSRGVIIFMGIISRMK